MQLISRKPQVKSVDTLKKGEICICKALTVTKRQQSIRTGGPEQPERSNIHDNQKFMDRRKSGSGG